MKYSHNNCKDSLHTYPQKQNFLRQVKKQHRCAHFSSTYIKIGTIQRRLAWPLHKDDMQIHEAFHIFTHEKMLNTSPY